jgi:hypothetical protein
MSWIGSRLSPSAFPTRWRTRKAKEITDGLLCEGWYADRHGIPARRAKGHFLNHGIRNGHAPNPEFDPEAYLQLHRDVRDAGIPAAIHYQVWGQREGRLTLPLGPEPVLQRAIQAQMDEWFKVCLDGRVSRPGRDAAFVAKVLCQLVEPARIDPHLANNPKAGEVAALTYVANRSLWTVPPNWWFDANAYMSALPYLGNGPINPLVHAIVESEVEGGSAWLDGVAAFDTTMTRPTRVSSKCLEASSAHGPYVRRVGARSRVQEHVSLLVSLTNDDPVWNLGGIQSVLREEVRQCSRLGVRHLGVFPIPTGHVSARPQMFGYRINGGPLSIVSLAQLLDLLHREEGSSGTSLLRLHGLLQWPLRAVIPLATWFGHRQLWIHDMSSVCQNYHLTWNDVAPCRAPRSQSSLCGTCSYGAGRPSLHSRVLELLSVAVDEVIFPDEEVQDIWRRTYPSDLPYRVQPLTRFGQLSHQSRRPGALRIAYCGFASEAKGFELFRRIAQWNKSAARYELFWIGDFATSGDGVRAIRVSGLSVDSPMIEPLLQLDIDLVLSCPMGFETYSLVSHEAVAAGAQILTVGTSGPIASMVRRLSVGHVFPDDASLFRALRDSRFLGAAGRRSRALRLEGFGWADLLDPRFGDGPS